MIYIQKGPCPGPIQARIDKLTSTKEWASFPEKPTSDQSKLIRTKYFDRMDKSAVRAALIPEQHGLCAYCMCAVYNSGSTTTIEHVVPLSKSKAGALNYQNWLAVCKGGQNIKPPTGQRRIVCCDVKKSNTIAALSPLNKHQMEHIAYCDDGTIVYNAASAAERSTMNHELNNVYGLNGKVNPSTGHSQRDTTTGIVKQRKDAYIAMFDELAELERLGELTPELITAFRESLLSDENWEPFIGVKLYVLDEYQKLIENP